MSQVYIYRCYYTVLYILVCVYCILCCKSSVFVVVVDLGLKPVGEDTGTADALSSLIIQSKCYSHYTGTWTLDSVMLALVLLWLSCGCVIVFYTEESSDVLPLFFPCGSIKREVLPTALRENSETISSHSVPCLHLFLLIICLFIWQMFLWTLWLSIKHLNMQICRRTSQIISLSRFTSAVMCVCFLCQCCGSDPCVCVCSGCSLERGILQSIGSEVLCGFGETSCWVSAGADQGVTWFSHQTVCVVINGSVWQTLIDVILFMMNVCSLIRLTCVLLFSLCR